jgi:hypothetical protein
MNELLSHWVREAQAINGNEADLSAARYNHYLRSMEDLHNRYCTGTMRYTPFTTNMNEIFESIIDDLEDRAA